jgi:hypothetical protein
MTVEGPCYCPLNCYCHVWDRYKRFENGRYRKECIFDSPQEVNNPYIRNVECPFPVELVISKLVARE